MGVVELTVALHYVFDTPADRIVWDVGHQAYPHKILTGRRARIRTLRQGGGLSGFTKRSESEYDAFGAGHSSTSISASLGMAVARDLSRRTNNVVAVIGDGAMSAGMAYEAMNNAGAMESRLIVILNDNDMSIAPPTGAMSAYLARLVTSHTYRSFRDVAKQLARRLPKFLYDKAKRTEEYGRGFFTGGTLFEELGFYYVGPIDGHNLDHLLPVLKNVRDMHGGPVLVHVVTKKGKGYPPAEAADDKYHGVSAFDVITGAQAKPKSQRPRLHQGVRRRAARGGAARQKDRRDHRRHAPGDRRRPDAGDLPRARLRRRHRRATRGDLRRRARDRRPEALLRDLFDLPAARLRSGRARRCSPEAARALRDRPRRPRRRGRRDPRRRLRHRLSLLPAEHGGDGGGRRSRTHAHGRDLRPPTTAARSRCAIRAARAQASHCPSGASRCSIGKGRILREGSRIAILTLGARLAEGLKAAEELAARGLSTTVADARFAKPLDRDLILRLAAKHELLITVEEGARAASARMS